MLSLENSAGKGPQNFKNLAAGITIVTTHKTLSGAIVCTYKRAIKPPAASSLLYYDVSTPHHVVYAFGNTLNGGQPSKHDTGDYGTTDKKTFIESQVRKYFSKLLFKFLKKNFHWKGENLKTFRFQLLIWTRRDVEYNKFLSFWKRCNHSRIFLSKTNYPINDQCSYHIETTSWFALQINWLVSIWWEHWSLKG